MPQPEMLDALLVLVEGDDIGDSLSLTRIVTDDEWQFDTQRRAAPGSSGRRRVHAMLPDCGGVPQHLHALPQNSGLVTAMCAMLTSRNAGLVCGHCVDRRSTVRFQTHQISRISTIGDAKTGTL